MSDLSTTPEIEKLAKQCDKAKEQYTKHQHRHDEIRAERDSVVRELARATDDELMLRLSVLTTCLTAWPDLIVESAQIYATAYVDHAKAQRAHLIRVHDAAVDEITRIMDGFARLTSGVQQMADDAPEREPVEERIREKRRAASPHYQIRDQCHQELSMLDAYAAQLFDAPVAEIDERHIERFVSRHRARVGAAA